MRTLLEHCEFIVDCEHKTAPAQVDGYPSIRTPNIGRGRFLLEGVNRVSERTYAEWTKRAVPRGGDLILAREAPVGNVAVIPEGEKYCLGQRTVLIRPDRKQVDPDYLCYLLLAPQMQGLLLGKSGGATVHHLNMKDIRALPIPVLPLLENQTVIASVIKNYDDLFTTNQRRIALLEDAARRLYREWFVHLRFPGHEAVKMKDGVPIGWQNPPLTGVANFINGFAFKPEHLQKAGLPVVKIPELRDGITSKTPHNSGAIVPQRNHVDTGDILFSWSATLLVNEWDGGPALLNQHLFKVVPHNELHKRLIRFTVEAAIPQLHGRSVGATMQHIRRSALDAHTMLVPDVATAAAFAAQVDPMMDAVLNIRAQNKKLTRARDALLPKLMSGQLDVSGITLPEEMAA